MNLSPEAEWIGAVSHPVEIKGGGVDVTLAITSEGQKKLTAWAATPATVAEGHIYLALETIRGTRDASILKIYISLPESAFRDNRDRFLAGSVGLFGLRRASAGVGESMGPGLDLLLDITPTVSSIQGAKVSEIQEIHLAIVPEVELPELSVIMINRISLYLEKVR